MKQILQNLGNGKTSVTEIPAPQAKNGHILIRSASSLVSAGTERMLVDFGKSGLISKARQQPDKVRQVVDKMKTDGIVTTVQAVKSKLDQPLALGYCNAGKIIDIGDDIKNFKIGDRVVSNSPHAEIVCAPKNLCAKIPNSVKDDEAAFTALGAIALQGIRLAKPTLGETVAVIGLGLIGLMAVQLLNANGCTVIGVDFDDKRLELAKKYGAVTIKASASSDPSQKAMEITAQKGVDAALICAATKSSSPISDAARMLRKRGRIIMVGATGMELNRAELYEKEISFQVSCSYGPGRYDANYEEKGIDYPYVFVEKPLALKKNDLLKLKEAAIKNKKHLMIGFNRRFAPLIQKMKSLIEPISGPKSFLYTCNAGAIPANHWVHDTEIGGGRILGEACHFIDLLSFLSGHKIIDSQITTLGKNNEFKDSAIISLKFSDGSIGAIHYLATGGKSFPKERIEVFANNAVMQMDNFRKLKGFSWPSLSTEKNWKQDKGQAICIQEFLKAIEEGKNTPISLDEIIDISEISIDLANSQ